MGTEHISAELLQAQSDIDQARKNAEFGSKKDAKNIIKGVVTRLKAVMVYIK